MEFKANADMVEQCSARHDPSFIRHLKKWRYGSRWAMLTRGGQKP